MTESQPTTNNPTLARAIWQDLREVHLRVRPGAIMVGGTLLGIMAHEVGGMSFVMGEAAAHAYEATNQPAVAGLAMGTASAAVELLLSTGAVASLRHFPLTGQAFERRLAEQPPQKNRRGLALYNTLTTAALLGSPGVVLTDFARHPTKSSRELWKTGAVAAGSLGVANATIGGALSGGLRLAEYLGHPGVGETAVTVAENPLTYLGLFAASRVIKGVGQCKDRLQSWRSSRKVEAKE